MNVRLGPTLGATVLETSNPDMVCLRLRPRLRFFSDNTCKYVPNALFDLTGFFKLTVIYLFLCLASWL